MGKNLKAKAVTACGDNDGGNSPSRKLPACLSAGNFDPKICALFQAPFSRYPQPGTSHKATPPRVL